MSFFSKMERKFGRHAIPNLMKYVVAVYIVGFISYLINPTFYATYLMLDIDKVLEGQVWRLITFVIQPVSGNGVFTTLLMCYVYYNIGSTLESIWGAFRFNLYYFSGILFNILAVILIYLIYGYSYPISLSYLNLSLFLAFSVMFSETRFLFLFLIPIKAKYLAFLYIFLLGIDVYDAFSVHQIIGVSVLIAVVASLLNFILMFLMTRNLNRINPKEIHRRQTFKRDYRRGAREASKDPSDNIIHFNSQGNITRHKCAICGRTEKDDPNLEFRFCSKCEGNYEYCSDHLYTHTHVTKQ